MRDLDFGVLAQCIHCGLCLPTCPTYDATKLERHSPRGRIQLMRKVAEGQLEVTKVFAEEMYFCLGCLACETACPAGVDYTRMFEEARADAEHAGVLQTEQRSWVRAILLRGVFTRPWLLRRDSPLRFRPELDLDQWRWIAEFLAACNNATADRTTQRLLRLAFYSRDLMHEDGLAIEDRFVGLLVLFYAQPLTVVSQLPVTAVIVGGP